MIKDGVALTKFFYWFESNHGRERMTEISLSDKLHEFRSQQKDFLGLSFATIMLSTKIVPCRITILKKVREQK